ncbi:MAG: type IX secretion system membrane protein PorP/SprF [Bacteroidales bacterium]|nr:type IX secretion system membrane protein PorP/SprF [Bacteroidales bacterium]MDD4672720.1 type IX secretion system membrane protein PorP/SprF [Bacteroidales bacterium]MDY0347558.1 type IX secretion system membrane protein PorP/SprF [Tenuifilaceae bacterium]
MKRKVLLSIVAVLLATTGALAQQLPQFTQYMFNPYAFNPAVGGTFNYYQVKMNNRFQWVGLKDAPQSYNLSVYGPHGSKDMGFGGNFFHDVTGPTGRTSGQASYSYNMQLTENGLRISGGVSLGFLMFRIDGSRFEFADDFIEGDPAVYRNAKAIFTPDASVGIYVYDTRMYAGISAYQLLGQSLYRSKLSIEGDEEDFYGINRLRQHFMLMGGILLPLNRDFIIEPSVLVKYTFNTPIQVDINAKVTYRNQFWGGLSFRWQDGVSLLVGYEHQKRYVFGYSFDYPITPLRKYSAGSHEIMLGFIFDKLK